MSSPTFLDLPVEIQHNIYDHLDVKHRAKLNMALPHSYKITHTLKTDPHKNKQIRYLSYMVEKKKYNNINQLSHKCMEFISANRDDPTIHKVCQDLCIAFDPIDADATVAALITDITKNRVLPTKTYVIPEDANLTHIQHAIAKHATPHTFDVLYSQNASTAPHIADRLLRQRKSDRSFFFDLVNQGNRVLLRHVMTVHAEEEWSTSGIAYLNDIAHLFFALDCVEVLCEVVQITDEKKKQILQTAIDQMDMDLADYMTDIGTTL